ncbi:GNAT family N-acetyltransferase [Curtobacterium ammoniigenes]|uniref:GNAT family N-acetyltransferase n=1 Tax=Curtobacterium ammoniigenes TaxID=395387 RepID=UPI001470100C|nr:GNAT family N-acetyltransferase [Curtobacterium ammoniigenes]
MPTTDDDSDRALRWRVAAESDLSLDEHEAIAAMLARSFDDWSFWFVGGRSWAGIEPEARVLATTASRAIVAHAGFRRMFVRAPDGPLLVAAVGLIAVSPEAREAGVGSALMRRLETTLRTLDVPLAVVQAGEESAAFFGACGWAAADEATVTYVDYSVNGAGVTVTDDSGWRVLPLGDTAERFRGAISWDGQLV